LIARPYGERFSKSDAWTWQSPANDARRSRPRAQNTCSATPSGVLPGERRSRARSVIVRSSSGSCCGVQRLSAETNAGKKQHGVAAAGDMGSQCRELARSAAKGSSHGAAMRDFARSRANNALTGSGITIGRPALWAIGGAPRPPRSSTGRALPCERRSVARAMCGRRWS